MSAQDAAAQEVPIIEARLTKIFGSDTMQIGSAERMGGARAYGLLTPLGKVGRVGGVGREPEEPEEARGFLGRQECGERKFRG